MKLNASKSVILAALALCGTAFAQSAAPAPESTLAFNAGLTTDYRYRGVSQSRLKPAVQAGVDYAHASGFYLGAWGSSIKWIKDSGGDGNLELDLYGGYKGTAGDVGYDVGVLTYQYPSNKLNPSANTTEIYGAVTFGVVTAKYSHSTTNLFGFANSKNSGYLDISATIDLGNGWSLVPHVGHQRVAKNSAASYTDYSIGVSKDIDGLILTAAIVGTDSKFYVAPNGKNLGRDGLVLSIKKNF